MATISTRQRVAAVVADIEEEAISHQPKWSTTTVTLQNSEQATIEPLRSSFPWPLLDLLWQCIRWGETERRIGLPLPATTSNLQSRSWSRRVVYSTQRCIIETARGQRGKDVFSSIPLLCSGVLNFICGEQLLDVNSSINPSWLRLLRAISFCFWVLCYYSYMAEGTPATMKDGKRTWFSGLTIAICLLAIIWIQQPPLVLAGIAMIITISTAIALWVQNLLIEIQYRFSLALSIRLSSMSTEPIERP